MGRIITVFRSREDLDAMRGSGQTPRGVAMFRAAGAEPTFTPYHMVDQLENPNFPKPQTSGDVL